MAGPWEIDAGSPRSGRHYPSTQAGFEDWIGSEGAARDYVAAVRFRDGATCPWCTNDLAAASEYRWWCPECRKHVTLTAGTLMQGTRVPIRTWLGVCWLFTQSKAGVSASTVERTFGLRYNTAWTLLHKIRSAMDQTGRSKLSGYIEIDECVIGAPESDTHGGLNSKKHTVIVACELPADRAGMGRIRLARSHDRSLVSVEGFITASIEPGSTLHSDGSLTYIAAVNRLHTQDVTYRLVQTVENHNPLPADQMLPHVHRVISLLKRWLLGTYHGGPQEQHLDPYLDEFVFRFNRRRSRSRGLLFWRLVCDLTEPGRALRYAELRSRGDQHDKDFELHLQALEEDRQRRQRESAARTAARKLAEKQGLDPDEVLPVNTKIHADLAAQPRSEPF